MGATLTVARRRPDGTLATHAHASIAWLRDMARDAVAEPGAGPRRTSGAQATPATANGRHPGACGSSRKAIFADVQRHLDRAESSLDERGLAAWWRGSRTEGALYGYNAALSQAVLLWSPDRLQATVPRILCVIRRYLRRSQARRISDHRVRHTLSHWLRSFYCRGISPTTGCGAAAPPRTAQLPEPRRRSLRPV